MIKFWIKIPGPGQLRGEGNWFLVSGAVSAKFYEECKKTDYLPTFEGDTPPKDDVQPELNKNPAF